MEKTITNYARFYSLLNRMPYTGDRNELKESLIWRFSNLRTTSLKEMSYSEYIAMCNSMEKEALPSVESERTKTLKGVRSSVLIRMQRYGIDTTDWAHINNFCLDKRISGKVFKELSIKELKELIPKLESMIHKDKNNFRKEQLN
jgi:hypothetical protein